MKIEGIELTEKHIGEKVFYTPLTGGPEEGTIKKWNKHVVFVEYHGNWI